MEQRNQVNKRLYEIIEAEYKDFMNKLYLMDKEDIIASSYGKVFKEDIVMCMSQIDLTEKEAIALMKSDHPLDECYREWLKSDYSYGPYLRDVIEHRADSLYKNDQSKEMER